MRVSTHSWIAIVGLMFGVVACGSDDDNRGYSPGTGGTGGTNTGGSGGMATGGTGGGQTGGSGGVETGGTGGGQTGGSGGVETGGTGGEETGGTGGATGGTGGEETGGTGGATGGTGGATGGSGGATGGTGGGSSADCELSFPGVPASCNSCFQDKCENQCVDVQSDPDFNAYQGCLGSCAQGDTQCQNDCDKQFPDLAAKFDTFVSCISSQCANECGAGGCIISMTDPTCGGCATANCNDVCETYSELPNAEDHLNCVIGCNDNTCMKTCDQTYPAEGAALENYFDCLGDKCAVQCPGFGPAYQICDSGLQMSNQSCATCLGDNCCSQIKACEANQNCLACITGTGGTNCNQDLLLTAVSTCWEQHCDAACKTTGLHHRLHRPEHGRLQRLHEGQVRTGMHRRF